MINLLFFAHLQEEIGNDKIKLETDNITVKQLKGILKTDYNLSQMDQVMVAINEEYALEDDIIKSGDTVALIPPVSGG
ncbi:molybdopterin converting factor subunit 1 [Aquibacillus kalidii]|uniref:molybdopterin converting factor subunit 1 n=1 Tax=Aquibacillus kalidii TaxID=2762597 RepID=UPI00164701A2|nr:molybdopterin converting factor subunit 1 [Aquibacillus kalidii]